MDHSIHKSAQSFRLVHLSDPHLSGLENVHWYELLNKRILGYLSWRIRRRKGHRLEVLNRLQKDFLQEKPDHILISGDLTHIGTEDECLQALNWLKQLDTPKNVSVIPGNHDCYAPASWGRTLGHWQEYMASDESEEIVNTESGFPSLRRRGPLAIIGLSTALPTLPFFASGKIGSMQLTMLAKMLEELKQENVFRVVTLHHGPLPVSSSRRRGLDNAAELRQILAKHGAELVLHGHGHRFLHGNLDSDKHPIPVFAVPSASARSDKPEKHAGYNTYEIDVAENDWHLRVRSHVFRETKDLFEIASQYEFTLPRG